MPRKRGWYKTKPGYKEVGVWGWDDNSLWDKVQTSFDVNECWTWTGSMSPTGALFGAWRTDKNDIAQMTQARRVIYMSETNTDVRPYRVTMTCGNQQCVNPNHFELKENNRKDKQW